MSMKLVLPITSKPFDDMKELCDNHYTFVVMDSSLIASKLIKKYKDEKSKVRKVYGFPSGFEFVGEFFWKQSDGSKYAVLDLYTDSSYMINEVKSYTTNVYNCYQLFPSEFEFAPQPVYFMFHSLLARELKVGLQKSLAAGFKRLFFSTMEFKHLLRSAIKVRD